MKVKTDKLMVLENYDELQELNSSALTFITQTVVFYAEQQRDIWNCYLYKTGSAYDEVINELTQIVGPKIHVPNVKLPVFCLTEDDFLLLTLRFK